MLRARHALSIALVTSFATSAYSQPYPNTLLKDIDPTGSSSPSQFVDAIGRVFFTADTPSTGRELWVSDGTAAGTFLVKDIEPGASSSNIHSMTVFGSRLLFVATTSSLGDEPWVSDGTAAGTIPLGDIFPGPQLSTPSGFLARGHDAFFQADDGVHGPELWKTDGTPAGTLLVADIEPGPVGSNPTDFGGYGGPGNPVWFTATRSDVGCEVFASDGTTNGTGLLFDIEPGPASSNPFGYTLVVSATLFFATTAAAGTEPWTHVLDSPSMLKDIMPGTASSITRPDPLTKQSIAATTGASALFVADNGLTGPELWRTNGTLSGTWLVRDIAINAGASTYAQLLASRYQFYALATTAFSPPAPQEWSLFTTDGSQGKATKISAVAGPLDPLWQVGSDDTVLFSTNGAAGVELYAVDGTSATPPVQMSDSAPGIASSSPTEGIRLGNQILFSANDGTTGQELHSMPLAGTGASVRKPEGLASGNPYWWGPSLSSNSQAIIGLGNTTLSVCGAPLQSTAIFMASFGTSPIPTAIGTEWLLASPATFLAAVSTESSGCAFISGPTPAAPQLANIPIHFQVAVGQSFLTAISNGLEIIFEP